MPTAPTQAITPKDIIDFLLDEMEQGISPSFYSNLVPSVFDIYLHADDYDRLRPLVPRVKKEAVTALEEKLRSLNKAAEPKLRLPGVAPKKGKPKFETLGDWSVDLHENMDDDAPEHPLVIHSTFPAAAEPDDRVGTLTERVTKRTAAGETTTTATMRSGPVETSRAAGLVFASLSYDDDAGSQTYQMTKELIKVGRGGVDRWVDLKLKSKKDISREHLQIRRDPASGNFFIKDLSSLGTTVDGKRVPPSIENVDGSDVDKNVEVPLPPKCRIGLAGVMTIDFKAARK
jgi:hypothetical protein